MHHQSAQLIQKKSAKCLDGKQAKRRELLLQLTSTTSRSCDPIINGFGANSLDQRERKVCDDAGKGEQRKDRRGEMETAENLEVMDK
jgi:hypothetical protein